MIFPGDLTRCQDLPRRASEHTEAQEVGLLMVPWGRPCDNHHGQGDAEVLCLRQLDRFYRRLPVKAKQIGFAISFGTDQG